MTDLAIRPLGVDDRPALAAIAEAADLFPAAMLAPMAAPALDGAADDLRRVALRDWAPVGFAFAVPEVAAEGAWTMRALAVAPAGQRGGAGRALVAAVEAALRAAGARLVVVDTSSAPAFAPARAFYEALGYEEEARIRDFWSDGDHKVTFRKRLD